MSDSTQLKKRKMSPAPENEKSELAPVAGLLIKRHSDKARLPTRGSALAAGYDLYRYVPDASNRIAGCSQTGSAETKVIPAHGKALVDTQISVAVPAGTYGRVAPRSGLGAWCLMSLTYKTVSHKAAASKFMIDTGAGVIDADYRGVVFVLLFNLSDKDFTGALTLYSTPLTHIDQYTLQ